jgi:hypothetical protein
MHPSTTTTNNTNQNLYRVLVNKRPRTIVRLRIMAHELNVILNLSYRVVQVFAVLRLHVIQTNGMLHHLVVARILLSGHGVHEELARLEYALFPIPHIINGL